MQSLWRCWSLSGFQYHSSEVAPGLGMRTLLYGGSSLSWQDGYLWGWDQFPYTSVVGWHWPSHSSLTSAWNHWVAYHPYAEDTQVYILPFGWTSDAIKVMSRFLETVWIWRRKRLSYNPRKIEKLWVWTNANSREILCFILNGVTSEQNWFATWVPSGIHTSYSRSR